MTRIPASPLLPGLLGVAVLLGGCRREGPPPAGSASGSPSSPSATEVARKGAIEAPAPGQLDAFPAFSPDGDSIAYASNHDGPFEIWLREAGREGRERKLTNDGRQNLQPCFTADGQAILYHSKHGGGIWSIPIEGGEPRQVSTFGSRPSTSPDGKLVAFQSDPLTSLGASAIVAMPPSAIWVTSPGGGKPRPLTKPGDPPGGHGCPTFTPDGKAVLFASYDRRHGSIWAVPVNGGPLTRLVDRHEFSYDPTVSPDGRHLYYGALDKSIHGIWRADLAEGASRATGNTSVADIGFAAIKHISLSRDGRRLAYGVFSLTSALLAQKVDPATLAPIGPARPLTVELGRQARPAFSPDGTWVAFTQSHPSRPESVWVVRRDGSGALALTDDAFLSSAPTWLPDGKTVAFLSVRGGHPALWTASLADRIPKPLNDPADDMESPHVSPDGRRVAFNSKKGGQTINVWIADLPDGAARQVTFDQEMAGFPRFSPDGTLLALQLKRSGDTHVAVVPASGGRPEPLTNEKGQSWVYGFAPDGDRILFAGSRDDLWNVWAVSRTTRALTQITHHDRLSSYVRYPTLSPQGDLLVYEYATTSGRIQVLPLAP